MINIQNIDDNECFKCSLVTYVNTADCNPVRITKTGKDLPKKLDFKGIKSLVKVRDLPKIEKNNSISISFFGYKNKENIQFMYQKSVVKKNILICYQKTPSFYQKI